MVFEGFDLTVLVLGHGGGRFLGPNGKLFSKEMGLSVLQLEETESANHMRVPRNGFSQ